MGTHCLRWAGALAANDCMFLNSLSGLHCRYGEGHIRRTAGCGHLRFSPGCVRLLVDLYITAHSIYFVAILFITLHFVLRAVPGYANSFATQNLVLCARNFDTDSADVRTDGRSGERRTTVVD